MCLGFRYQVEGQRLQVGERVFFESVSRFFISKLLLITGFDSQFIKQAL